MSNGRSDLQDTIGRNAADGMPEVIGEKIDDELRAEIDNLISDIDVHLDNEDIKVRAKMALMELTHLKIALDESSIVAVTDHKGKILYVNDKFCEISQYERSELIGKDHRIINSGYHSKQFFQEMWQTIKSGQVWRGELRNRAKGGNVYWVNTTIVPFLNEKGEPYQYMAIRNEVTKLKETEEELQRMMTKVIHIQEEERRRISRELHDGIGQSLFALQIQLDRIIMAQQTEDLKKLRGKVSVLMDDVRNLAWELRPSVLDDLGVIPAIRTYIDNYSEHYGIAVNFDCKFRTRLDVLHETVIYRVIQEALTNIARYADVTEASVTIEEQPDSILVRVEDEGRGFVRDRGGKGVGLFSMEERARSIGAALTIQSENGRGTIVELSVPKQA